MSRIARRPPDALVRIVSDRWTAPYWQAAADGWLTCAQCAECQRFRMPPTPFCPNCRSQSVEWPRLPGTGRVFSFTIVERAVLPSTEDCVPYVVGVIDLDGAEPARIIANIVDCDADAVRIGAPVRVLFDAQADGHAVPRFTLSGDRA